ncbi:galectin-related protein-like [Lampris incognitus]|uniref:galectin-related protein-like n=1 Tax=Lampris incognitus TaxID=2546036 RepID=UPI0024B54A1F|nr:galectin-related protein-like [Lampris incognitus]
MAKPTRVDGKKSRDYPQSYDHLQKVDSRQRSSSPYQNPKSNLAVPFRGPIKGGMRPGKKVIVVGVIDSQPNRFYIVLSCGCGSLKEAPSDVALELSVRFKERLVLRRACVSRTWSDTEKTLPFFPFIRDQPFRMEICCEQSRFRVMVDGQQLFDFNHRVAALEAVDTIWIKGSVKITKLG